MVRSAMHHAGAAAFSQLLQFPEPTADQLTLPCACGRQAVYQELRSKPILTAVGKVEVGCLTVLGVQLYFQVDPIALSRFPQNG